MSVATLFICRQSHLMVITRCAENYASECMYTCCVL